MTNSKKVALAAVIILSTVLIYLLTDIGSFKHAKLWSSDPNEEIAMAILSDADINFNEEYLPFVSNLSGKKFTVHYLDSKKNHQATSINVASLDVSSRDFVNNYLDVGYFKKGFGNELAWNYSKQKSSLVPSLELQPKLISSDRNFFKMSQRPHVECDGKLVEEILDIIPFTIRNDECFFVIDEKTRMTGWFYFKSSFDGEDFVGCYDVAGWSGSTTYEELINLKELELDKSYCQIRVSG